MGELDLSNLYIYFSLYLDSVLVVGASRGESLSFAGLLLKYPQQSGLSWDEVKNLELNQDFPCT